MTTLNIGDIVARKSYGGDVFFIITDIITKPGNSKPSYVLKGLSQRIQADSYEDDLLKKDTNEVYDIIQREVEAKEKYSLNQMPLRRTKALSRFRERKGRILHLDSSKDLFDLCSKYYSKMGVLYLGKIIPESDQPRYVKSLLQQHKPDLLVLTGHDSMKKGANYTSIDSYSTSKYFIQSVREARKYQPNMDKLFIYAGACQSYFEAIMEAGANFASSPGRILIHGLDPAIVVSKFAVTDTRKIVLAEDVVRLTKTGSKGIGGINSKGRMVIS